MSLRHKEICFLCHSFPLDRQYVIFYTVYLLVRCIDAKILKLYEEENVQNYF